MPVMRELSVLSSGGRGVVLKLLLLAALPRWEPDAAVGPGTESSVNKLVVGPLDLEVDSSCVQLSASPHGGGKGVDEEAWLDPCNLAPIWSCRSSPAAVDGKLRRP